MTRLRGVSLWTILRLFRDNWSSHVSRTQHQSWSTFRDAQERRVGRNQGRREDGGKVLAGCEVVEYQFRISQAARFCEVRLLHH